MAAKRNEIEAPTAVYRFYDMSGQLLYVGVTDSPGVRWASHRKRPWWREVVRYEMSWHSKRHDALVEEMHAIENESPRENLAAGSAPDQWMIDVIRKQSRRPKQRVRGEGSVRQRKSDGIWIAEIDCGYTATGGRRKKSFSSMNRDVAVARLEEFKAAQHG